MKVLRKGKLEPTVVKADVVIDVGVSSFGLYFLVDGR